MVRITDGILQIDLIFLHFFERELHLQGTDSAPVIRFMFQTLHDHLWSRDIISEALFSQSFSEAERWFGTEIADVLED